MIFDLNYNKKMNMSMILNAKNRQINLQQNMFHKMQNNQKQNIILNYKTKNLDFVEPLTNYSPINSLDWLSHDYQDLIEDFQGKYSKECKIPLHIYQTWHSKFLPPKMQQCVNTLKEQNPEFVHHLYDDDDCYKFIRDNYSDKVLNAYVSLVPGAFKADLWRYCILYKNGGIYLDIKYKCAEGIKLINMVNKDYYTQDRSMRGCRGVYNGVIICKKNDVRFLKAIHRIIFNVKNKHYGESSLVPTGPGLLGKIFTNVEYKNTSLLFVADKVKDANGHTKHKIVEKESNKVIFIMYDEYREEQSKYNDTHPHYEKLWQSRNIYR